MRTIALVSILVMISSFCNAQQELKSERLYKKVLPSVMTLAVEKNDGSVVLGTAFMAIKDGVGVTAWHVVQNAKRVVAKFSDGEEFEVSGLIDKDESRDVALIRTKTFGKSLLSLARRPPNVGIKVYVIGSPRGLEFSISDGLLSQVQTVGGVKLYQFSCPASPGNSGGPLVNALGEVLGVVSSQLKEGQNLNFAIPSTYTLGLDPSLPTTPWTEVKEFSSIFEGTNDKTIDKYLISSFVTIGDIAAVFVWINKNIASKDDGFKSGVPSELYAFQRIVNDDLDTLQKMISVDPKRERIRVIMINDLHKIQESIELLVQCLLTAYKGGRWSATSNDLYRRSQALIQIPSELREEDLDYIQSTSEYLKDVSPVIRDIVAYDSTGFMLGVATLSRNPLDFIIVLENSFAYELGFRSGDVIVSADGKRMGTIGEFKKNIKEFLGRNLKIVVERNGVRSEWDVHIPKEIPEQYRK